MDSETKFVTDSSIEDDTIEEIAIIGIAGRFPGSENKNDFWRNLANGTCSIKTFSDEECREAGIPEDWLNDPDYVRTKGMLENPDLFAADFFAYSPKEAERIDPQQRIFLECAWEAMEDAGYVPDACDKSTGVFAGSGLNYYLLKNVINTSAHVEDAVDVLSFIGSEKDFVSTRVSYKLNLRGPSLAVQTACSSSLVAVHLACQSLLAYQCDMTICGGVSLQTPRIHGYKYTEGEILSPDGQLRAFDAKANGTIFGEGAGVVVLKRLSEAIEDRDNIYAVIKSTAINNDGGHKVGFTAPSMTGQIAVVDLALNLADIEAESISYIEAHGTGTHMGDPIEVRALSQVYDRSTNQKRNFCALGSVKANIGHLDVAAGVTGLIKTALSLQNKKILPQINYETPNPELNLEKSPFYINTELADWPEHDKWPRRAGVSSFGMGGTNAHVIMEEAPAYKEPSAPKPYSVCTFSAKSRESLLKTITAVHSYLSEHRDLDHTDIAYTLTTGRKEFTFRYSVVCKNLDELIEQTAPGAVTAGAEVTPFSSNNIIFLFPGQGSQYLNMAAELYGSDPAFKQHLDRCAGLINNSAGIDIITVIFNSDNENELNKTRNLQLALFAVEYSLAAYLSGLGITPGTVIGHSLGEITAACIAGIFSLEDAVAFVSARGKAMQNAPAGSMLAAAIDADEAETYTDDTIFISAMNSSRQTVFSGTNDAVQKLELRLNQKGITTNILKNKNPFHTELMQPVLNELRGVLNSIKFHKPQINIIANVSGKICTADEMSTPGYWEEQIVKPVRFKQGCDLLFNKSNCIFVEVGPGNILSSLLKNNDSYSDHHRTVFTLPHPKQKTPDMRFFFQSVGKLWEYGTVVDWKTFFTNEKPYRVSLPTTVFDRKRYWLQPAFSRTYAAIVPETTRDTNAHESMVLSADDPDLSVSDTIRNIWKEALGYETINEHDNYFEMGGNSLIAAQIISRINRVFSIDIPVTYIFDNPSVSKLSNFLQNNNSIQEKTDYETIPMYGTEGFLPLTAAQKRLWFLHEYDPAKPVYNLAQTIEVNGTINIDLLKQALTMLIERHTIFNTSFTSVGGEPQVVYKDNFNPNIEIYDYTSMSSEAQSDRLNHDIVSRTRTPFDFTRPPLYSVVIYRLGDDRVQVVLFVPHIINDGWSFNIFQKELEHIYIALFYEKEISLAPLSVQYTDFAVWQEKQDQKRDVSRQISFWQDYLGDSLPVLQLPTDYSRPAELTNQGNTTHFTLADTGTLDAIKKLSAAYNVSDFIFVQTALSVLLHKYSGQETVIIGTPYANRGHVQVENIIGCFLNMLPIRSDFTRGLRFSELMQTSMSGFLNAVANNEVNFEHMVEFLNVERYQNINPVFQVMLAYQNYLTHSAAHGDVHFRQLYTNRGISEYDLSFYLWEKNDTLAGALEYSTELFRPESIQRMISHFKTILTAAVTTPESAIADIHMITPAETELVTRTWNNTARDYTDVPALPNLFCAVAETHSNNVAVRSAGDALTYRELNEKSNQMARFLSKNGATEHSLVGVLLERNCNMLIALLGILKAGAAYIPLDPDFPVQRLELMVKDSKIPLIVTQKKLRGHINTGEKLNEILIDADWQFIQNEATTNPELDVNKENTAYVLYTSGSTGIPNGVQIPHSAFINFLLSMQETPGITEQDTMLALTTLSFDIAGLELFLPLISGATVEIITHEQALDGLELQTIIAEKNISIMQATPATYQLLFESGWKDARGLKVLCGGEAMSHELAARFIESSAETWNMYGPTETTVWSSVFRVSAEQQIPLVGKPIANTQFYVLDKNMQPVPPGIAGELYIGGHGVANGYINRTELTAKRFRPDPFAPTQGSTFYKTGDMVRFHADGNLEFLGRIDFQVKIRGYRIELEDIETAIGKHPAVIQVVCTIASVSETDKRIVAYIRAGIGYEEAVLKTYLADKLPEYMVPNHFFSMERFPLTPNGKIDRKTLPKIDFRALEHSAEYFAPQTEEQKKMAIIWQQVLEIDRVGITDSFFDMGGHSLLATRLVHQMNQNMGSAYRLRDLFSQPTIEGLTSMAAADKNVHIPLLFPAQPKGEKTPLFLVAGVYDQLYYAKDDTHSSYENDFLRYFNNLIITLDNERPVYGLRPRGIFLNEEFHKNIHDMAYEYINEIKAIQPHGPYLVGGECLGGIVAFEIAQQLMNNGDNVALCILMDTYRPDLFFEINYRLVSKRHKVFKTLRRNLKSLKSKKLGYFKDFAARIPHYRKILLPVTKQDRKIRRVHLGSSIYERKLIKYRPKEYKGEVVLIINEDWNRQEPNLGWNTKYCRNLTMKIVPGNHSSRLTKFGKELGKVLRSCIKKVMVNYE